MEQDKCAGKLIVSTLTKNLPSSLDLLHYFDGHPRVDPTMTAILLLHASTVAAGHVGAELAQYGIFPAQIIDVLATISRTISCFQREHHFDSTTPIRIGEHTEIAPPTICWDAILAEVIDITDLEPIIAYRLLMWLYAVATIKPRIIPGFIFKPEPPIGWAMPGGTYCDCVNALYEPWSHVGAST